MKFLILLCFLLDFIVCKPEIYNQMSFTELEIYIKNLKSQYPNLVKLETAQEKYGLPFPGNCSPTSCPIYIMTLTEFSTLENSRPQVFFSGAVHGDEVVGPNAVAYLASYLLKNYRKDPWITYLLQNRVIVIMPAANANGFYNDYREEFYEQTSIDPNRDFPYNLDEQQKCMESLAARSILHVFKEHAFILGVTFHGGDNLIGYEWGSENHMKLEKADESPDDKALAQLGLLLQSEAGEINAHKILKYDLGKMGDIIYAVQGGLEDWAYAASWANNLENKTERMKCNTKNYGGFDENLLKLNEQTIRFPLYLVETWYNKHPPANEYGNENGIMNKNTSDDGHIPRNIRLCLTMIDMVKPYIRDIKMKNLNETHAIIEWKLGGSLYVNETFVEWGYANLIYSNESISNPNIIGIKDYKIINDNFLGFTHKSQKLTGQSIWIKNGTKFEAQIPYSKNENEFIIFRINAKTDLQWSMQKNPIPKALPLTHFAKLRINSNYAITDNENIIYSFGTYSDKLMIIKPNKNNDNNGIPLSVFVAVVTILAVLALLIPLVIWLYFRRKYQNYEPMDKVESPV